MEMENNSVEKAVPFIIPTQAFKQDIVSPPTTFCENTETIDAIIQNFKGLINTIYNEIQNIDNTNNNNIFKCIKTHAKITIQENDKIQEKDMYLNNIGLKERIKLLLCYSLWFGIGSDSPLINMNKINKSKCIGWIQKNMGYSKKKDVDDRIRSLESKIIQVGIPQSITVNENEGEGEKNNQRNRNFAGNPEERRILQTTEISVINSMIDSLAQSNENQIQQALHSVINFKESNDMQNILDSITELKINMIRANNNYIQILNDIVPVSKNIKDAMKFLHNIEHEIHHEIVQKLGNPRNINDIEYKIKLLVYYTLFTKQGEGYENIDENIFKITDDNLSGDDKSQKISELKSDSALDEDHMLEKIVSYDLINCTTKIQIHLHILNKLLKRLQSQAVEGNNVEDDFKYEQTQLSHYITKVIEYNEIIKKIKGDNNPKITLNTLPPQYDTIIPELIQYLHQAEPPIEIPQDIIGKLNTLNTLLKKDSSEINKESLIPLIFILQNQYIE